MAVDDLVPDAVAVGNVGAGNTDASVDLVPGADGKAWKDNTESSAAAAMELDNSNDFNDFLCFDVDDSDDNEGLEDGVCS